MAASSTTVPQNDPQLLAALQSCIGPGCVPLGCNAVLSVLTAPSAATLNALASLPLGRVGQRLVALRYLVANGDAWLRYFAWETPLARLDAQAPSRVRELWARVQVGRTVISDEPAWATLLESTSLSTCASHLETAVDGDDEGLRLVLALLR